MHFNTTLVSSRTTLKPMKAGKEKLLTTLKIKEKEKI